jgi:spermidine synthase
VEGGVSGVLWGCFVLSGAAALALEMLWMRSAALAFGSTAATNASVLVCYFAGLAVGGAVASRGSRRPVRAYGRLELGVALGAGWSVAMFAFLASDAARTLPEGMRLAALAVAILPATTCLGATLPTLGHALARGAVGRRGGLLYALNTFGAAAGAALAGFGLPAAIGVRASYVAAIVASAAAGVTALAVGDRSSMPDARRATHLSDAPPAGTPWVPLYVVAAATGALGLGLEVLWTRVFAQVLHNSIYSFTAIALVFLLAIAAGAALAALLVARVSAERVAAGALAVAGASTVGGYWLFVRLTDGFDYVGMTSSLAAYVVRIVALAAVTAGPAALAAAAVLPALWQASGAGVDAARPLGRLASANGAGCVAGALVAGFFVVPSLGVRAGLLIAAVSFVLLAGLVPIASPRWRALQAAIVLALVVASPERAPLTRLRTAAETLRATFEGPSGIVTVVDAPGDRQLRLDTFYTLGGSASVANERRQGLIPLLLHPDPQRVAFIGLATGVTASAAPALGVRDTTVVELVPEVVTAARLHFATWNDDLLEGDRVHLVVDDGRRYLAATDRRFDVIVSDLFIPWHAGTGSLYGREMYTAAARRLEPGGLFCQWLPLYQLTREEFDVIARTFLDVFPHVSLWRADFYADRPVVGLVGQLAPRRLDLERVHDRTEVLPRAARDAMVGSPRALAMLYAGDLTAAADLFAAAPLNTDDHPVIEFLAPRLTRMSSAGDKDWFTGEALAGFYEALDARPSSTTGILPDSPEVSSARRAGLALFRYALAATRHDDRAASTYQATVRDLVPDVIASAETTDETLPFVDPTETLQQLHVEESDLRRRMTEMERRLADVTGGHP